jgi:hypothetical protein
MTDPDKTIYDRATGTALETVKAHSEPKDLKCFFSWFCPYVAVPVNPADSGSTSVDRLGREARGL